MQPIYVLTPGSEYRIGVGLFQAPGGRRLQLQGASWLRIGLPGGQPVTVPLDQDEGLSAPLSLQAVHAMLAVL